MRERGRHLLLGLAAVVALALPTVAQAKTVDRTVSCPVASISGMPSVGFRAQLFKSSVGWWVASEPGAPPGGVFVSTLSGPPGLKIDSICAKAPRIPLARGGLPRLVVLDPSNHVIEQNCPTGSRVVVRVHSQFRGGFSVSGQATVLTGAKLRPLLYVSWTTRRVSVYATGDCTY